MSIPDRKKYGAKPFWAWNGNLKKEELLRQVHVMKDMGFGGFFMHSRTGLETPYLEDEWFDLINAVADEAKRLDMEAWLYDEDRWPSGSAGGKATTEDKYRMKYLRLNYAEKNAFVWSDDIISAFATDVNGLVYTRALPLTRHADVQSLDLPTVIYFTAETMLCDPNYNNETYLDTLSKEATEHFIDTTHRLYKEKCGDRVGDSIRGIFTDEPYRGALMSGFSVPNRDAGNLCPYTPTLFNEFANAYGYRLETRLPELFLQKNGNPYSIVKWQYTELITRMFIDNFGKVCHDWCKENGFKLTGHILHENSLTCQVSTMGSVMRYYEHMDIPGVDYLGEYGKEYCVVKQLASACRQVGKTEMLSELDGCTGWQMTFDRYKHIGDWQAIMGITLRCPHLSWYTMKGEAKRDYPASILHQSAWHEVYDTLEDYYTRLSAITARSKRVCHTAVLMPVESVWAQIHASWACGMGAVDRNIANLDEIFEKTYNALFTAHRDFDYADEGMLAEIGSASDGLLTVGKAKYDTVIVSGMVTMRRSTFNLLKAVRASGGKVVFVGELPAMIDVMPTDEIRQLAQDCKTMTLDELARFDDTVKVSREDILLQTYEMGDRTVYMCLNKLSDTSVGNVTLSLPKATSLYEYFPLTGKTEELGIVQSVTDEYRPGELRVYMTYPLSDSPVRPKPHYTVVSRSEADDSFSLSAGEPNMLVLDHVTVCENGEKSGPFEVLEADRRFRDAHTLPHRGGLMLQPWFIKNLGDPEVAHITLRFTFHSTYKPERPLYLMYEDADRVSSVTVNGVEIDRTPAEGVYIDICFTRIDISSAVKEGENTIEMQLSYHASSGLEAVYLIGEFLADASTDSIRPAVGRPMFGSLVGQGYPYYGGKLTYHLTFHPLMRKGDRAILKLSPCENVACYEVGKVRIPFAPFEADITEELAVNGACDLTVYLTRRNSFGPFYQGVKNPGFVGPDSFNDLHDTQKLLFDVGLKIKPTLEIIKETEN